MNLDTTSKILLENARVRLEPLSWEHLDALLPLAIKHPTLLKYSPSKFGDEPALRAYFEKAFRMKTAGSRFPFAIFDKAKNAFAGSTSFLNISNENQRLEIGSTWLGKEFQRSGLNRNCKFLLLKHAFETLDCQRVEFKTDDRNEQSKTAIEAIGAKYEGLLRSHTLMTDGHRRDSVYFSILKDEWKRIKGSVFKKFNKKIENFSLYEIDQIFEIYEITTEYMKQRSIWVWPAFERSMVEKEIAENKQWKLTIDNEIACIWATAYRDPHIWEEKDKDPAVYIHRIATTPVFRGSKMINEIVEWAKQHAVEKQIKYVRLDTVGNNPKLIEVYTNAGFEFLGMFELKNVNTLPSHYQLDKVALFEIKI